MCYSKSRSSSKSTHTTRSNPVCEVANIIPQSTTCSLAMVGANPITYIRFLEIILMSASNYLLDGLMSFRLYTYFGLLWSTSSCDSYYNRTTKSYTIGTIAIECVLFARIANTLILHINNLNLSRIMNRYNIYILIHS